MAIAVTPSKPSTPFVKTNSCKLGAIPKSVELTRNEAGGVRLSVVNHRVVAANIDNSVIID